MLSDKKQALTAESIIIAKKWRTIPKDFLSLHRRKQKIRCIFVFFRFSACNKVMGLTGFDHLTDFLRENKR